MKPFWQLHRWHLLLSYYQGVCKIVTRYKGWPEEPQIVSHLAGGLARERRAVKHHCTRHPPPPTSPSTASASFNTIHPLHHHHYRQVSSQCFNAGSTYNLRSLPLLLCIASSPPSAPCSITLLSPLPPGQTRNHQSIDSHTSIRRC